MSRITRSVGSGIALLGLGSLAVAQSAVITGDQETEGAIYYDFVHPDGSLGGGVLPMDANDPQHVDTRTARERQLGQALALGSGTNVTTVIDNGPSERRIDIVFVGDGYTAAELGAYANHVDGVIAGLFQEPPLDAYASFFNVHRVDVISNESGVDNDPVQGISRDTALNMAFWCGGTERLLCVNVGAALNFANLAPGRDSTLALANSTKYGGAGYLGSDMATLSGGNGAALEIALHEFGHSFGLLADEYTYGGPSNYTGGEPSRANVSTYANAQMAALEAKWHEWLGTSGVSTFEGAQYSQTGIYRPTNNSLMRSLNRPFDAVNVEQMISKIYERVRPIDDATPAGEYPPSTTFFVDPIDPVSHSLDVQWFLNGAPIAGATGLTLDASTLGLMNGLHSLRVQVVDPTPLVIDEGIRASDLSDHREWTISNGWIVAPLDGCSFNPLGSCTFAGGSPIVGGTMEIDVRNPLGNQATGSIGALAIGTSNLVVNGCGVYVPGLSMTNGIFPGELLVSPAGPSFVSLLFGPPTSSATGASRIPVSLPSDPSIVGLDLWVQGALLTTGPAGLRIGLARGLRVRIGS